MVFDFLRKAPLASGGAVVPERKASAVSRVVAWGTGGRAVWVTAATGGTVRRRALMPGTSPMPRAIWRASRATEPPRL